VVSAEDPLAELAEAVRTDAAMLRAREILLRRLADFTYHLGEIGFSRVTLTRDGTGMLVLSIDPDAIIVRQASQDTTDDPPSPPAPMPRERIG